MRVRHAPASLALGGVLALAGAAVPAQAAESAPSKATAAAAAAWHLHSTYYNNPSYCEAAGKAQDLPYKCVIGLPGPTLPIHLYVWY
ncbi:hypothetical protein GCM10010277_83730 [Streptomyces longisporoflavus]|uniref:hypothetical protein n=1 Tax=Streptomyces longisporoflavus TaxID=28044 RepID=UPI00167C905B|nr:hypothetical protein [Streptomyces longisporoflavus]GGV71631.1 hypothetical protein GCM10010277_83730 [Streptomyces longisporoflavus]